MDRAEPQNLDPSPDGRRLLDGSVHSYVLRSGRMTDAQRRSIEMFGPDFLVDYREEEIDLATLYAERKPLILEIGFGMGQATWRIARDRPRFNYLGIEVHTPGVGRLIMDAKAAGLANIKIVQHDAIEVLRSMIPDGSLAGIHVFYPDPWPKKRHHKRRLMQDGVIRLMAQKLTREGYLYFVTDIEEYAHFSKEALDRCELLRNAFGGFAPHQEWRPETKFERHAKNSGRGGFELLYTRL